jgi:protein-disulfide isomerase
VTTEPFAFVIVNVTATLASGAPPFFINGRLLSGAQSLETFARVINDELARVKT